VISRGFTGAGLAVRGGSVVASWCEGFADAAEGRRWSLQTRTQVASISKQFAAAVTLLLVHQGAITLEDSVAAFLSDCPTQWRAVSIRQLLTHTSGMAHWCELPGFDPAQPLEPAQRLGRLRAAPLTDRPGQNWRYSSPGYIILAAVLEQVAHLPYVQLVEDHIIGPLELTATTVGTPLAGDSALGYRHGRPVTPWQLHAMPGTGDICSNATDLARFVTALHAGTLLPAQIQPLLHGCVVPQRSQPQASVSPASVDRAATRITSTEYCAGHFHGTIDGQYAYLHPGDNPGYQSLAAWLPDTGTVIVALSNHEDDDIEQAAANLLGQTAL
jgi:CubicO group peptidase (beta-lactamase class C family)